MRTGATQNVPTEGLTMSAARLFVGLCVTCNNADHCVYRKRRGTDAIYCETFDGYAPANGHGGKTALAAVVMTPDTAESEEFKGLCVNCLHRDACKLPRPEGGVWHCEEYE